MEKAAATVSARAGGGRIGAGDGGNKGWREAEQIEPRRAAAESGRTRRLCSRKDCQREGDTTWAGPNEILNGLAVWHGRLTMDAGKAELTACVQ